jgi:hypothetical protein
MYLWCSSLSIYIYRRAWRSPIQNHMMWWIHVSAFNDLVDLCSTSCWDVVDLWCHRGPTWCSKFDWHLMMYFWQVLYTPYVWPRGQACLKCNNGYTSYSELLSSCQVLIRWHDWGGTWEEDVYVSFGGTHWATEKIYIERAMGPYVLMDSSGWKDTTTNRKLEEVLYFQYCWIQCETMCRHRQITILLSRRY